MHIESLLPSCFHTWWMVVITERPPAASWQSEATRFMAVVESRPEVGSAQHSRVSDLAPPCLCLCKPGQPCSKLDRSALYVHTSLAVSGLITQQDGGLESRTRVARVLATLRQAAAAKFIALPALSGMSGYQRSRNAP